VVNSTRLRPFAILQDAISEVSSKWQALLYALVLPASGSAITTVLVLEYGYSTNVQWMLIVPMLAFYALFATSCHRIILLGAESLPNEFGLYWSYRETRFTGWLVAVAIVYALVSAPFALLILVAPQLLHDLQISWYLQVFVASYFEGRFSMVLPATAVDQKMDLRGSWYLTRGSGLAIAVALFIPALGMDFLHLLVANLLEEHSLLLATLVSEILVFPMIAVAVSVLSVTYRSVTFQE
jgi:hypothetical protein